MLPARTPVPRRHALRPVTGTDEQDARERDIGLALQRGEGTAAAALWDHFAPLVRGLLARALGPAEEVEVSMQEVFLRVFHRGHRLRDPGLLRRRVVAITVHHLRARLRRRRVRRAFARLMGRRASAGHATLDPAPGLALRALYRALEQLPSDERLVFSLRFFEGAEIAEAAALLSTSAATVKRRLAAAKQRLWASTDQNAAWASGGSGVGRPDEPGDARYEILGRLARAGSPVSGGAGERRARTRFLTRVARRRGPRTGLLVSLAVSALALVGWRLLEARWTALEARVEAAAAARPR